MLCRTCRRQVERSADFCPTCGRPAAGSAAPYELVLAQRGRVLVDRSLSLGRGATSDVWFEDASVSRNHARIVFAQEGPPGIEDTGSRHGTWVDGRRVDGSLELSDGAVVRLGDVELRVERRRSGAEAGRTLVVAPGATLEVAPSGTRMREPQHAARPRVRSGWALKRLEDSEGSERNVLRDLRGGELLRLDDADAQLFECLDGSRGLTELILESERVHGAAGPVRLAALVAALAEHGMLDGVDAEPPERPAERRRAWVWEGAGAAAERLYERGSYLLFTRPLLALLALVAVAGPVAFGMLLAEGATPFVVAGELGIGAAVFIAGRLVFAGLHELAHALALVSFGRRPGRAGLRLLGVFPVAFVDTTESWFEPRRRRLAITAAGPAADLVLAGACGLAAVAAGPGATRDTLFQLAFGSYLAACANLNPLADRDGRLLLADALREPDLRSGAVYRACAAAWAVLSLGLLAAVAIVAGGRFADAV